MIVGEAANFAAYAFAPAVLVTPLGALSIIVSAVLAHHLLGEKLNAFGILGCILCIAGSLAIVLHAPAEAPVESVLQIWRLATRPAFLLYAACATAFSAHLAWNVAPKHGETNILVYIGICSVTGSLSVTSCKALGVALKLTARGNNQLASAPTYIFLGVLVLCLLTQMNYLNKALDLFNTAVVSPIYYVMFTTATIVAAWILFRDPVTLVQAATQLAGFVTVIGGVFLLHATRELDLTLSHLPARTTPPPAPGAGGVDLAGADSDGGAMVGATAEQGAAARGGGVQGLAARLRARSGARPGVADPLPSSIASPEKGVGGAGGGGGGGVGGGGGHTAIEMIGVGAGAAAAAAAGGIGGTGGAGGGEDDLQPLLVGGGGVGVGGSSSGNGPLPPRPGAAAGNLPPPAGGGGSSATTTPRSLGQQATQGRTGWF
jgi:multidrug transporter EmrE-like cation transporter